MTIYITTLSIVAISMGIWLHYRQVNDIDGGLWP